MRFTCSECGELGVLEPKTPVRKAEVEVVKCVKCNSVWDGGADKHDEKHKVYLETGKDPNSE